MQNVFITGGTGYLGTSFIKALQNDEYNILALVRKVHKVLQVPDDTYAESYCAA